MAMNPTAADAEVNRCLSASAHLALYRDMVRLRAFETRALSGYQNGLMAGFMMLQIGQESLAVGLRSVMGPLDHSICGARGMGYALAAGLSMRAGMAELYGKATGVAGGKSGQWGFFAPEHRHWGNHSLAGSQAALGTGLAFGLRHRGEPGVVCSVLGDGSMNQGVVHEAMNLAALMGLPVVFIIENNGFGMGTSTQRSTALGGPLARRAEAYGMSWATCDGDDILEVREHAAAAIEQTRRKGRPRVLEIATYRFEGFAVADANKLKYRRKEDVADRIENHDPIKLWQDCLLRDGIADEATLKRIRHSAADEAEDAANYARQSPFPTEAMMFQDVLHTLDHRSASLVFSSQSEREVKSQPRGRYFF